MYGLKLTTAPAESALTLETALQALRWVEDDDQAYINEVLIPAAVDWAEAETGRQLITASWTLDLDQFPCYRDPILIPRAPLQAVTSVKYYDTDGVLQTWDAAEYVVQGRREPAEIRHAFAGRWPSVQHRAGAVEVEFVAGYGDNASDVPVGIRQAMALVVGHWFANREAVVVGTSSSEVPLSAANLIAKYKPGDAFHEFSL